MVLSHSDMYFTFGSCSLLKSCTKELLNITWWQNKVMRQLGMEHLILIFIPTTFDNYSLHKSCNMTLLICKLTMYSKVVSLVGSVLFHCSHQIWFISGLNINTPVFHSKTLGIYISRVFWTNQYTNQIYKGATMVGDELGNFPNLCLQIL